VCETRGEATRREAKKMFGRVANGFLGARLRWAVPRPRGGDLAHPRGVRSGENASHGKDQQAENDHRGRERQQRECCEIHDQPVVRMGPGGEAAVVRAFVRDSMPGPVRRAWTAGLITPTGRAVSVYRDHCCSPG
jgi:hypothetical protein